MKIRSAIGLGISYGAYVVCFLSLVFGVYNGYLAVTQPVSTSVPVNRVVYVMAYGGMAMLSFAVGKTARHMADHPRWDLNLDVIRDSIRFR